MKKQFLFVLALLLSLSTFAKTPQITQDYQQIANNLEKQIQVYDKGNDNIEIYNIKVKVIKLTKAECTISVSFTAKLTLFGTGVEVELSASVTAETCAEASKLAWQGVTDAAKGIQEGFKTVEQYITTLFD